MTAQHVTIIYAERLNNSRDGNPRLQLILATEHGPLMFKTPSNAGWVYELPCAGDLVDKVAFAEWHITPTGRYVLDGLNVGIRVDMERYRLLTTRSRT